MAAEAAAPPQWRLSSRRRLAVLLFIFAVEQLVNTAQAQNRTSNATTDRAEATNQWNISGELCSGVATDSTPIGDINPGIKCDCSFANNSTCHITALRVYEFDVAGPIPDELWNLTYLSNLTFGVNALSGELPRELGLLRDLRSLYFDSAGVNGPIPASFARLQSLERVWASDNELTGQIPDFIGSWSNLAQLRFQGNSFQGRIPPSFSNLIALNDLDLSYNELSGGFPSWISGQNLQLALPRGLDCLQRNFPCYRGLPIYSSFAIKCGGPEIRSSDQIVYEIDNETLGPATYYMINTQRWAVSNVGLPSDSNGPQYTTSSSSQFTNTLDSELFQTARISAGSLRYYGLGLENGNYTVRLRFAEARIEGNRIWKSLGRRVFDIYIQGNLQVKDFDIRREAGGASLRAITREFTVEVSENYMEIHLFWAGIYGPSISAISATPDFNPTVSNNPPSTNNNQSGLIVGIVAAIAAVGLVSLVVVYYVFRRRKMQKNLEDEELLGIDARPYTFSYAKLRAATDDFNPTNKLGEGGFGPVYKGTLEDGRVIAVKQLSMQSHQGKSQFVAEIATISAVQHRIARGLAYLHEESRIRIVHRDVKASNILLNSDLIPKISDFGLAKLYDDKKSHISTRVAGTIGYVAPEYAMRGHLTEKADTFSFGVLALEIISGRPNSVSSLEDDMIYLLEWAWDLHENNKEIELVDPKLRQYNADEVRRIIGVSLLCTQASPALRPAMSRVVAMLCGDIEVAPVTSRPGYLTDWKFNDQTTSVSNTDCSTSNTNISHNDTTMTITADNSPINAS
ncbi:Serine/threonine protein kinase [Handroanthus impetiginosus]|uniref:non-specific serine/threonine protein kinase n=1 Tax=Handroanthus impetiginosus TaxID=429701 RepID=A0A2G9HPS8_9LAMI|nr:Serine/threonine protein kinase [Handroanthus impetiginosus]